MARNVATVDAAAGRRTVCVRVPWQGIPTDGFAGKNV